MALHQGSGAMDWDEEVDAIMAMATPTEEERLREALVRIRVCCANGSPAEGKLSFIAEVAANTLDRKVV